MTNIPTEEETRNLINRANIENYRRYMRAKLGDRPRVLSNEEKLEKFLSVFPARVQYQLLLEYKIACGLTLPRNWGNPELFSGRSNSSDIKGLRPRKFGF